MAGPVETIRGQLGTAGAYVVAWMTRVGMWQRQRDDDYVASMDWFTEKLQETMGFSWFFEISTIGFGGSSKFSLVWWFHSHV